MWQARVYALLATEVDCVFEMRELVAMLFPDVSYACDRAAYNRATATVSRALDRLQRRQLIEVRWHNENKEAQFGRICKCAWIDSETNTTTPQQQDNSTTTTPQTWH